jgi:FtsH-binding integral membrane protein
MAEYQTIRSRALGVDQAQIDEGLRAHMNKVYATMSGGMLITAAAAWAIATLSVTSDPTGATVALREGQYLTGLGETLYTTPLRWVVMFAPLAFLLFGWGALMRRGSAAAVSFGFFAFAAAMGVSMSSIFLVFTSFSIVQTFLGDRHRLRGPQPLGLHHEERPQRHGHVPDHGRDRPLGGDGHQHLPAVACDDVRHLRDRHSVFAGLTAFYTQQIKSDYVAHAVHGDQEWLEKAAIDGALSLYISFLNMFQFLLMFMGQQE